MFCSRYHMFPGDTRLGIVVMFNTLITKDESDEVTMVKQRSLFFRSLGFNKLKTAAFVHDQMHHVVITPTQDNLS